MLSCAECTPVRGQAPTHRIGPGSRGRGRIKCAAARTRRGPWHTCQGKVVLGSCRGPEVGPCLDLARQPGSWRTSDADAGTHTRTLSHDAWNLGASGCCAVPCSQRWGCSCCPVPVGCWQLESGWPPPTVKQNDEPRSQKTVGWRQASPARCPWPCGPERYAYGHCVRQGVAPGPWFEQCIGVLRAPPWT